MQLFERGGAQAAEEALADESRHRYLLFSLKGETYGAPLTTVREVLKLGAVKPVPYKSDYFLGVINLRGQIVSIIDLGMRFGLSREPEARGLVIVVETKYGVIGAVVTDLLCVKTIQPRDVEKHPSIDTQVPPRYCLGIAKTERGLVNLVDASGILGDE